MSEQDMANDRNAANFDSRPTVPAHEYELAAHRINVGYELVFELATALLRASCPDDGNILVVGAGGGMEVQTFGLAPVRWHFTGIDPSANMLTLAQDKVAANGLSDRVQLIQGIPNDLPLAPQYDAATCMFVLMHLPDDGSKLRLLQSIARRLKPGAPLILADSVRDRRAEFVPAWQHYSVSRGIPVADMAAFLERIKTGGNTVTEARNLELLTEAGFSTTTRFFTAFVINGWLAIRVA
jgi:tRNA (cmo5U34)-methyltransferase